MRYASIRKMDISNGPGIRVSLFTQGCDIHCEGCFNCAIWSYEEGHAWSKDVQNHVLDLCEPSYISGISILGGEPLSKQNYEDLKDLLNAFKKMYPNKSIWMWTGHVYEELNEEQLQIVRLVDVLVDGPWIEELGDFKLKFKGSSNQRIIDVKETLKNKTIVELKEI